MTRPDGERHAHALWGGKAANLFRIANLPGVSVPPFEVVCTDAFRESMASSGLAARIQQQLTILHKDVGALDSVSKSVQELILETPITSDLLDDALRNVEEHFPPETLFAVRSSAVDEDTVGLSFAGLHDSFLFVRGRDQVRWAVIKVWASAFNKRALAYRLQRGARVDDIAISVVVQKMVDACVSGVMFTTNPTTGDVHEIVISSLYGAGEGLVSAGFDADTYTVDKESLTSTAILAAKSEKLVFDRATGAGLVKRQVEPELQAASSLSDEEVLTLSRLGLALEKHYGRPLDIEFCLDGSGLLWTLQVRPITTAVEYGPAAGNHLIWDNSNIIESYSGVTSPMTFSFIRRAYTIVYHNFADVMGVPASVVGANRHTFANMLGLFHGRVYYNLLNWYRLVRLFPGFNYNKQFMESMMGVREPVELKGEASAPGLGDKYFRELPALVLTIARSTWNFAHIRRIVGRFQDHFNLHYDLWAAMDFHAMPPHELMRLYDQMEKWLLWSWKAPIINDFFVMIFYGLLKKTCVEWCGDATSSLQNDLLCGEGDIESTEPTKMLLRLAFLAQCDPALHELLLREPIETLCERVRQDGRFKEFTSLLDTYLERYGFRCMNELKLEEYSLRDRPAFLFRVIRNYLALDDATVLDVGAMEQREQRVRSEAEALAFARVGPLKRPVFRWILANARRGVKNRENMRFARTRIYGLLRDLIRSIGRQFAEEGILSDSDDIFYLTLDEVWDFIKGTAVTTDLKGLAALRRKEFDGYRNELEGPDDRFDTYGIACHRNLFKGRPRDQARPAGGLLRGIGCCPGTVEGQVKVLRTPKDDMTLSGEILVAERTDPGWVPLYPSVSGILVERGSILSHSAVVAREMGIPIIVGITGLIASLKSGMIVRMDGRAGTVEILDEQAGAAAPGMKPHDAQRPSYSGQ